jgi:hypothetical protein
LEKKNTGTGTSFGMTILFPRALSRIESHNNNTTTWEVPGPLINANSTYPKQSDFFGYLAPTSK